MSTEEIQLSIFIILLLYRLLFLNHITDSIEEKKKVLMIIDRE
jgi:hypothetical protein